MPRTAAPTHTRRACTVHGATRLHTTTNHPRVGEVVLKKTRGYDEIKICSCTNRFILPRARQKVSDEDLPWLGLLPLRGEIWFQVVVKTKWPNSYIPERSARFVRSAVCRWKADLQELYQKREKKVYITHCLNGTRHSC